MKERKEHYGSHYTAVFTREELLPLGVDLLTDPNEWEKVPDDYGQVSEDVWVFDADVNDPFEALYVLDFRYEGEHWTGEHYCSDISYLPKDSIQATLMELKSDKPIVPPRKGVYQEISGMKLATFTIDELKQVPGVEVDGYIPHWKYHDDGVCHIDWQYVTFKWHDEYWRFVQPLGRRLFDTGISAWLVQPVTTITYETVYKDNLYENV